MFSNENLNVNTYRNVLIFMILEEFYYSTNFLFIFVILLLQIDFIVSTTQQQNVMKKNVNKTTKSMVGGYQSRSKLCHFPF